MLPNIQVEQYEIKNQGTFDGFKWLTKYDVKIQFADRDVAYAMKDRIDKFLQGEDYRAMYFKVRDELAELQQRTEQEPVALQYPQKDIDWQREQQIKAQASTPPQRTFVGLTRGEIEAWELPVAPTVAEFAWFIEAKIKQKNGYAEEKNNA